MTVIFIAIFVPVQIVIGKIVSAVSYPVMLLLSGLPFVALLSWRGQAPMVTSLLATGGDLVFTGEPSGAFNAYDARSGELLWQFHTGSGIHGNPVSYAVNGKQYVAIPVGWGGWLEGFAPKDYGRPRATALYVFALP